MLVLFFLWPKSASSSLRSDANCPKTGRRYGIMFDAGSTGSRIHVFDFTFELDGSVKLHSEVFEQLKPGLSAYADDPQAAVKSLDPLMKAAYRTVPRDKRGCTPIELKATAGLRLIGQDKANAILGAVERSFKESEFLVRERSAIVMDGKDEGPLAWITINFLLGTLFPGRTDPTAAAIDMGGGSTQIVFNPTDLSQAPPENVFKLNLWGRQWNLYTKSHLGYGLKEAEKSMMKAAAATKATNFPCFPKGHSEKGVANEDGDQSFDTCKEFALKLVNKQAACSMKPCSFNGAYQPNLQEANVPIYVFSYFYDRMEPYLKWSEESGGGKSSVGELKKLAEKTCNQGTAEDHNLGTMCMDLTYLYTILNTGYDMQDDTSIFVKKKINGVETAWCLGAMLLAMR